MSEECGPRQRARIQELQDRIQSLAYARNRSRSFLSRRQNDVNNAGAIEYSRVRLASIVITGDDALPSSELELLRAELDSLIAGECALCGDFMIKTVSKPFISTEDREEVKSWAV